MLGNTNVDVLLVGQTPPPHHGQAVVTGMLFEHEWGEGISVERLRMSYSQSIDDVGKFSISKIWHLIYLVIATWRIVLRRRPKILYYLPASPNRVPILRDIVYLRLTRWLFPKTVFHYHAGGIVEYVAQAGWLGRLAEKIYSEADGSIELSEQAISPSDFFKAKKKYVVANGLDVRRMKNRAIKSNIFNVLFVGALVEGKGIGELVETARLLKTFRSDVKFSVVGAWGSDAYRDEIIGRVKSEELEKMFDFCGVLTGEEKWSQFSKASCFMFPTHYASESFPLVLIEALAYGLPLVTTKWRGIPQLVGTSGSAFMLPIHSPKLYAKSIETLMDDEERAQEMSKSGQEFYEQNYTRERFLERMEIIFREQLSS